MKTINFDNSNLKRHCGYHSVVAYAKKIVLGIGISTRNFVAKLQFNFGQIWSPNCVHVKSTELLWCFKFTWL